MEQHTYKQEDLIMPYNSKYVYYELKIGGVNLTLEYETANELNAARLKIQAALSRKQAYVELQDYLIVLKHVYYIRCKYV